MGSSAEHIRYLKFHNSVLRRQLESFRNGNAYQSMRNEYEAIIRKKDAEIRKLEKELAAAINETVSARRAWSDIFDDLEKEHKKEMLSAGKETERLKNRVLEVERQRDAALDKAHDKQQEIYRIGTELEEEKGKNQKLTAQVNKDFQNSSVPSSQQGIGRKKIPNSRKPAEKKRGGQPGHGGHTLEPLEPTETHTLPDPEEYAGNPEYYDTGKVIKKQKIILHMEVKAVEYTATVFRSRTTGSRVHARFPEGYVNDVNYDGTVKAAAFLLANECNVSCGKIRTFFLEVSGGKLSPSEATINGLCEEFSSKTGAEKQDILNRLMTSPVLNTDFTNANVNGEHKQVLIVASPSQNAAMFYAREQKGHNGIKGTVLENYVGTLVHDHDTTFYSYGMAHQECMQHNDRYATGSEQNEPEREWNKKMHSLFGEMLHYKKWMWEDEDFDPLIVADFERRYDGILEGAKGEYEDEPPTEYYREGYNLYKRLVEYKESELLFLHDKNVPADNSLAERLARLYKRKQKQAMVLRSDNNFEYLCDDLGLIYTLRFESPNMYEQVSNIFNRKRYRKKRNSKLKADAT